MKPLRCLLGFHDWCIVLPGARKIKYKGREWWPMSGFDSCVCHLCDTPMRGQLLMPVDGKGAIIRAGPDEEIDDAPIYCSRCGMELTPWERDRFQRLDGGSDSICFHCYVEEYT